MTDRSSALWPPALAVGAMVSVQLGSALSVGLIGAVGAAGTAWLRLSAGALLFLVVARPRLRSLHRRDVAVVLALGTTMAVQTTAFLTALEYLPLGTCVAIEFLGPLTVAAVRSHRARALVWPGLALVGVVMLTEPWHGNVNPVGIAFAVTGAAGWGCTILLTQQLGDRFDGLSGLALTVPVAAAVAAVVGIPEATAGHLSLGTMAAAAGLALLLPVIPYAFELIALRRLTAAAFSTLMALEPAIGLVLGVVVLHQTPSTVQLSGIALVVVAGAAAQRGGRRLVDDPHLEPLTATPVGG